MNAIRPNALALVVKPQHAGKKKSEDALHMSKFVLDDGTCLFAKCSEPYIDPLIPLLALVSELKYFFRLWIGTLCGRYILQYSKSLYWDKSAHLFTAFKKLFPILCWLVN